MKIIFNLCFLFLGFFMCMIWTGGQQMQIDKTNIRIDRAYQRDDEKELAAKAREMEISARIDMEIAKRVDMLMYYERLRQIRQVNP